MPNINVDTNSLLRYAQELESINKSITSILDKYSYVKESLDWDVKSASNINSRLRDINERINEESKKINKMRVFIENAVGKYDNVDLLNKAFYEGKIPHPSEMINVLFSNSCASTIKFVLENITNDGLKGIDGFIQEEGLSNKTIYSYDWFTGKLLKNIKTIKSTYEDLIEEYTFKKPEILPEGVDDFFDTLSTCGILVDITKELKKYYETGDGYEAYKNIGLKTLKLGMKEGNKYIDEATNFKTLGADKFGVAVLYDTVYEMGENWINGIYDYARNGKGTAGSIFVDTTVGALGDAVGDAVSPFYKGATAISYPVVDQICEAVGYDLSAEYKKLTGKTGIEGVFAAQKELWVDIVYEGAKDVAGDIVDGFYDTVKSGWENWKSGMSLLFG